MKRAEKAKAALPAFLQDFSTHWDTPEGRLLGHVVFSPPLGVSVGSDCYTEDWAVIEIDSSKIDSSNFLGNVIDLGTSPSVVDFSQWMTPNLPNRPFYEYLSDRLLKLQGIIPVEEMWHPPAPAAPLNASGEPCLMVTKRGSATGLTVGRASNICSYVRNDSGDGIVRISKEWAIIQRDLKSNAFAEVGDSGAVIVDGLGRMGGLLTGGAGKPGGFDITYATPVTFLLKCMEEKGLYKPNINPILTA